MKINCFELFAQTLIKEITRSSSIPNSLIYNCALGFARNVTLDELERLRFWFKFHASAKRTWSMRRFKPYILLKEKVNK